jgi:DNA-binding Xre family transcriptional regulator
VSILLCGGLEAPHLLSYDYHWRVVKRVLLNALLVNICSLLQCRQVYELEAEMIRLKVKEVAQAKGVGQGKLARLADMDVKTVKRVYRDPYAEISTFTLDKFAKALGVDASELIESVPDIPLKLPEEPEH